MSRSKIITIFFHLVGLFLSHTLQASLKYQINSSGVYLGARGSRVDWHQQNNKYLGYAIGPIVGLDYRKPSHIYAGYRFYWMYGSLKQGSIDKKYKDLDLHGRVGYTFGETFLLTPYFGLGLNITKLKDKHTNAAASERSYHQIYVPIGVQMSYHPSSTFSFGLDYQYLPQIDCYALLNRFKNITFDLKRKGQHQIEFPLQFVYPKPRFRNFQYRIVPFYKTYAFGSAKIKCSCDCLANVLSFSDQKAWEWGVRYEIAIW